MKSVFYTNKETRMESVELFSCILFVYTHGSAQHAEVRNSVAQKRQAFQKRHYKFILFTDAMEIYKHGYLGSSTDSIKYVHARVHTDGLCSIVRGCVRKHPHTHIQA